MNKKCNGDIICLALLHVSCTCESSKIRVYLGWREQQIHGQTGVTRAVRKKNAKFVGHHILLCNIFFSNARYLVLHLFLYSLNKAKAKNIPLQVN